MKRSIIFALVAALLSACVAPSSDESWAFYAVKDASDIREAHNLVDVSEYKRSISCKPDPNNGIYHEYISDDPYDSIGYIGCERIIQRETSDIRYTFEMVKIHALDDEDIIHALDGDIKLEVSKYTGVTIRGFPILAIEFYPAKWEIAHFRRYRPPFKWEEYDRAEIGQYAKATYKFNYIKREFEYAKIYKLALTDGGKIEEIEESVPISECLKTMEAIKKYNAQAKQNAKNIR